MERGSYYTPGSIEAVYEIEIAQAGEYVLWGRVIAPTGEDDSFYVQMDDGEDNVWDVSQGSSWHWDQANNRGVADPVIFLLTAGHHALKIKAREDGTKIDKLLLIDNMEFVPTSLGDFAENVRSFPYTFPGATWESATPANLGLDSSKLDLLAARIGGSGCIVKDGYMVKTWGSQTSKFDWFSAFKPIVSTLLFFAVDNGLLESVDSLVYDWGWNLISKDQTMTFRHLANMLSGYARVEPPGEAWAYNNDAFKLYALTMETVFNMTLDEAVLQYLAPLQFEDGSLITAREGYGLFTTPRDFGRIGWFWLNKGNWNGQQLLPESYFNDFMKSQVPGNMPRSVAGTSDYLDVLGDFIPGSDMTAYGPGIYGFNWWFNDQVGTSGVYAWPDAPHDTVIAMGSWGQDLMVVIPSLKIVVAASGWWGSFEPGDVYSGLNQNLKLLIEAVLTE